jgi:predicted XRE-type DNA-binding protein
MEEEITKSSGNLYADLGFKNAEEMEAKAVLARDLYWAIKRKKLSQPKAANLLEISLPSLRRLLWGKIDEFSMDCLLNFQNQLGSVPDIEVSYTDYTVPILIQGELGRRANDFSEQIRDGYRYLADARGKFVYLCRMKPGDRFYTPLGRLTYEGNVDNMTFVLLNSSTGKYDPKLDDFPGAEHLDGTIEGALWAIIAAYPVRKRCCRAKKKL